MKIGVLTLVPRHNYGGILQAVALCGFLEQQGHEVVLINKVRFKRGFLKSLLFKIIERLPFQNIKNKRFEYLKSKTLRPFLDKYLPRLTQEIVSSAELSALVDKERFDAVIVGSDQVWRYQYIDDGHYSVFFLDFMSTEPVKKFAYAASFGKDYWEKPDEIDNVARMLEAFDAISLREQTGTEMCGTIFGVSNCMTVLDPTMLVGAEFYERFLNGLSNSKAEKNFVTYILDSDEHKESIISAIKNQVDNEGGASARVNLASRCNGAFYTVEEWLWHIKTAEFVVTDSFHGMLFSVLFGKQFIVIGNEARGLSRFTDFLKEVDLLERLYLVGSGVREQAIESIDYSDKNRVVSYLRKSSVHFLSSIGGGEVL